MVSRTTKKKTPTTTKSGGTTKRKPTKASPAASSVPKAKPKAKTPAPSKKAAAATTSVSVAHSPPPPPSQTVNEIGRKEGVAYSGSREPTLLHKFQPYHMKAGETYMSEGQLIHFRRILETWKKDLMKEVDHTLNEMKEADVLPDPNDRATQEETFNLELRTRDRERKLIRKIEEALKQIDEKEYGYCESCGVEIGIRRLEARPTAAMCIDCKTIEEIRERTSQ